MLSENDIAVLPAHIQSLAWKAINIKDLMLDVGRIIEAYTHLPGLVREAIIVHKCQSLPCYVWVGG
jgi:hypothetical protein